ncbi:MAG: Gldg family protein [Bacteroides sp.]|nr:Gldg family protein [Prevotella sp.]MCM1407382.1 Gldg family protein [Treponema brennaborense]MCM1469872.1 Gldg family protein [Bacteroides sp.]
MNEPANKKSNRFFRWLCGAESDFALFIVLLVLLNLVGARAFFRIDLTAARSYSLSAASAQLVRTLEEPLSVKVFFSANLPSPYNSVEQYVRDMLVEYGGAANNNFSYEFFDMEKPDNQELARSYNLNQVQIQEVKDNEIGFKNAYMSVVLVYSDRIETLDNLTSAEGLEYKLTSAMSKMIATANTLAGLSGKVRMTLYVTPELSAFGIGGFDRLENAVTEAYAQANKQNRGRISFDRVEPRREEIQSLVSRYGIQRISWQDKTMPDGTGEGVLGLVLEYGDNFRAVPLKLMRGFFGDYAISGLDDLSDSITQALQSLVSKTFAIGYITGHGELDPDNVQNGAGRFSQILSDRYECRPLNLAEADIPTDIASIIINGPRQRYSDAELYKIDQFLMRGGNILVFADSFEEVRPEGQAAYYQMPQYIPIDTGLDALLEKYGVTVGKNYVLDKNCYEAMQQGYGKLPLYYAPLLQKDGLNKKHPVSKNLGYVLMVNPSSVDIAETQDADASAKNTVVLAKSSSESWLMTDHINLNPMMMSPPAQDSMKQHNLAVIAEGKFTSAFDAPPAELTSGNGGSLSESDKSASERAAFSAVSASDHLAESLQPGKLFVAGTSGITTAQVIDETGSQPIALFIRNAVDYMNGMGDLCEMRTKGLSLNTLRRASNAAMNAAKAFNQYCLPLLAALAGLFVWRKRTARRRKIRLRYNAEDSRES